METSIRTFIAIKITPEKEFLNLYSELKELLNDETIKWVEENNFHLTLRFLGNTTQSQVEEIQHSLEKIVSKLQPFQINIKGIGYFESKKQPRVLFAKIDDSPTLQLLATEIKKQIIAFGFKNGTREFSPHLTLGRIKFINRKNDFYSSINKFEETEIQKIIVSKIILYQSILKPGGPIYKPVKIINLNKMIAKTPQPPYYAVIFTSTRTSIEKGYSEMANKMVELAKKQPGFLGFESAREEIGITVSYWKDLESIKNWKKNLEHSFAQKMGKDIWYQNYKTRIAKVELDYDFFKE